MDKALLERTVGIVVSNYPQIIPHLNTEVFAVFFKHYGPGDHPGTGTPQEVHDGEGGAGGESTGGEGVAQRLTNSAAAWQDNLSSDEDSALGKYVAGGYSGINNYLRHPENFMDEDGEIIYGQERTVQMAESKIPFIQSALDKSTVPQGTVLYRKLGNDIGENLSVGDLFIDKGFVSTSIETNYIDSHFKGMTAVINVAEDIHGAYLGIDSNKPFSNPEEQEVLLKNGLTFSVTSIEGNTIYMDVKNG